jgi:hypothetical protein
MINSYSTLKAFNAIDTYGFKFIDSVSLTRFLNKYRLNQKDILALIRRLDVCANSKISFTEFSEALKPMEPYFCS